MERARVGREFSSQSKQYVHDRANGHCEFGDGTCPNPNTNRVNHLTGCLESKLIGMNPEDIRDPKQNAVMECKMHEAIHDIQERKHVAFLRQGTIWDSRWEKQKRRKRSRPIPKRRPYRRRK